MKYLLCLVIPILAGCATDSDDNYIPSDGYIPDSITAEKVAQAVWIPIYGEKEIVDQKPFETELIGRVWHVQGTFPPPAWETTEIDGKLQTYKTVMIGGTAEIEIDRYTGKIRRVIHGE